MCLIVTFAQPFLKTYLDCINTDILRTVSKISTNTNFVSMCFIVNFVKPTGGAVILKDVKRGNGSPGGEAQY